MKEAKSAKSLSLFQAFALMVRAMLGGTFITLPAVVARELSHNGWLAIVGLAIVIVGLFFVTIKALRKWPEANFIEILHQTWGKCLGTILAMMVVAYLLYVAAIVSRIYADSLHTWFLGRTPLLVILGSLFVLKVYASLQSVPGFTRLIQLIFIIEVALMTLLLPIFREVRWIYLQPLWPISFLQLILPTYKLIYIFIGFEILLYYNNCFNKRSLFRVGVGAISYVMLLYVITVVAVIGFFGPTLTAEMLYPVIDAYRAITFPVIERLEIFFLFSWNFALFSTCTIYFYTAVMLVKQLFNISRDYLIFFAVPMGVADLLLAMSFNMLFIGLTSTTLWVVIVYLIFIMITCLVVIAKKGKNK